MDIEKMLFDVCQNNKGSYDLYKELIKAVNNIIEEVKGKENAKFYKFTINLLNSINNAGWEERHSSQIQMLWDIQSDLVNKYEKYLP